MADDWRIATVARLAGTTSRTLRHYEQVGLLHPSRVAGNGYRYYDRAAIRRLQRILLLREQGMGLAQIALTLDARQDEIQALEAHLVQLAAQRDRIDRQMASVRTTISSIKGGGQIMAQDMLDGFDHNQYRDEVIDRWGQQAWDAGDKWWRDLGGPGRQAFTDEHAAIAAAWAAARDAGLSADDPAVAAIAQRHIAWIRTGWGGREPSPDAIAGLADMYVADERFAANYGGVEGAAYVRDGLITYVLGHLPGS